PCVLRLSVSCRGHPVGLEGAKKSTGLIAELLSCAKQNGAGSWQMALHLLWELVAKGPKPRLPLYGATMSACARDRQWHAALELLRSVRQQLLRPDSAAY
ncbi:unnamed protein product, partial [Polarella glacialis]